MISHGKTTLFKPDMHATWVGFSSAKYGHMVVIIYDHVIWILPKQVGFRVRKVPKKLDKTQLQHKSYRRPTVKKRRTSNLICAVTWMETGYRKRINKQPDDPGLSQISFKQRLLSVFASESLLLGVASSADLIRYSLETNCLRLYCQSNNPVHEYPLYCSIASSHA